MKNFHAARRAKERFGMKLSESQLERMAQKIASGDCVHLVDEQKEENRPTYAVRISGVVLPVVFDSIAITIVTVLPWSVLNRNRERLLAAGWEVT